MGLDIRMPIGLMFAILGLFLTGYGLFGDKSVYYKSLGVNINLIWGVVLIVFSAVMIVLAMRGNRNPSPAGDVDTSRRGH
jgi:hypothetical protein